MTDLVDQMFPPINQKYSTEYTDNSYWNAPIMDVQLPDLAPPSPALSARSDQTTGSTLARIRNFSLRGPRATSPEPGTSTPASTVDDGQRGRQGERERQRTVSSISRISGALASLSRSVSPGSPSGTSISALSPARSTTDISEVEEDEFYRKSERRRRERTLSMPGSLQGSEDEASDGDDEGDGALFGDDGEEGYGDGEDEGVGGEMEEPTFDEDLFATGEMSKVPFL